MIKLLVLFRRVLHFEQVGISSPSRISSLMNRSKQLSNLHRLDVGSGTLFVYFLVEKSKKHIEKNFNLKNCSLRKCKQFQGHLKAHLKSQNGSNVTLVLPHTVHFSELFNCPTNRSFITELSTFEYHSHVRSALILFDKLSPISSFSPFVPVFNAQCSASKKKRKNSCASCCEQPLYMRCFAEKANFNSLGVTDRCELLHISLINLENSTTMRASLVDERISTFVLR